LDHQRAVSGPTEQVRSNVENRLVGKALKFWESVRRDGDLPLSSVLDMDDCPFGAEDSLVIEVGVSELEDRVVAAGARVQAALGRDPTGLSVLDTLPSSTEMGLSFCRASVDLKKPMADVGRFFNKKGQEVLYRSILLPLSDDGSRVNRVVSAFSYKVVH
tara:strand:- start:2500 stop:2979 length:480 start_codon:yes stop_codon:yes gene_type:complete